MVSLWDNQGQANTTNPLPPPKGLREYHNPPPGWEPLPYPEFELEGGVVLAWECPWEHHDLGFLFS